MSDHIESPEVELCGHKWKLRIFPGGSGEKGKDIYVTTFIAMMLIISCVCFIAQKHKKFISVYLANRSSMSVTASYKLSLRDQNSNVDVELFESSGVKTFEVQGKTMSEHIIT